MGYFSRSVIFHDLDTDNLPYEKVGDKVHLLDTPFDIPESWEWIRFKDLVDYSMGKTPPRKETEYWSNGALPWVSIADLVADGTVTTTKECVNSFAAENTFKGKISKAGTLLMSFKLTVGKVSVLGIDAFHNEAIISIYPFVDPDKITTMFLFATLPLLSQSGDTKLAIKGNTLNSDSLDALLIPLPPIMEQKRIFDKLHELTTPLLDYGAAAQKVTDLNANFPEALKKSILQEAVQGKLVPQDPSDEPAEALLERIRAEKQRLIKEGKIKKDKRESVIFRRDNSHYEKLDGIERCIDDEIPFALPVSWEWVRLGYLLKIESGKPLTSKEMKPGTIPVYGGNGITGYHNDYLVEEETVVIGRVGYYCGSVHVTEPKAWVTDNAFITTYPMGCIDRDYLVFTLRSMNLGQNNNATAQPVVSGKKIYPMLFPLPPLAEQKRIALKLKEILPFCKTI